MCEFLYPPCLRLGGGGDAVAGPIDYRRLLFILSTYLHYVAIRRHNMFILYFMLGITYIFVLYVWREHTFSLVSLYLPFLSL